MAYASSHTPLLASQMQPMDVIRPAIEPRYIAPAPPGIDANVYSAAQPVVPAATITPLAAPPPCHHLPPPGISLGPPPLLLRPHIQPPPPQTVSFLPPGVAHPGAGRAAVMTVAPPPTYPLPGTVTVIGLSISAYSMKPKLFLSSCASFFCIFQKNMQKSIFE